MTIDLSRFTKEIEAIVPIVGKSGKFNGQKLHINREDGWYKLLIGNKTKVVKPASPLEIYKTLQHKKSLMAYSVGSEAVPVNFDNFRKMGYDESISVNFVSAQPFDVIKIVQWEDGNWFFYETELRFQRQIIQSIKEAYNARRVLPQMRGITPEIRYAFLLANFLAASFDVVSGLSEGLAVSSSQSSKLKTLLGSSWKFRIESAVSQAGGTYLGFRKLSNGDYLIEWEVGGQTVKSQIHSDLRVVSAGYCLNGDDKRHSIGSLINLAKLFQEDDPLYITRE